MFAGHLTACKEQCAPRVSHVLPCVSSLRVVYCHSHFRDENDEALGGCALPKITYLGSLAAEPGT